MTTYMRYTYGLESYSVFLQAIRVGFFTKIGNGFSQRLKGINYLCKKPHLRCFPGFLICVWVSKLKRKVFSFSFQIICSVKAQLSAYVDKILWVNKGANTVFQISRFIQLYLIFTLSWTGIFLAISISNWYFEDNFCPLLCEKKIFLLKNYFLQTTELTERDNFDCIGLNYKAM